MVGGNSLLLRGMWLCFSGEQGAWVRTLALAPSIAGLAQRGRLGALSAAGVGCTDGSWLTSFQLEEKTFL